MDLISSLLQEQVSVLGLETWSGGSDCILLLFISNTWTQSARRQFGWEYLLAFPLLGLTFLMLEGWTRAIGRKGTDLTGPLLQISEQKFPISFWLSATLPHLQKWWVWLLSVLIYRSPFHHSEYSGPSCLSLIEKPHLTLQLSQ